MTKLFNSSAQADAAWPGPAEVDELLGYLPLLYPGGVAIKASEVRGDNPWPLYVPLVQAFFAVLDRPCWTDVNYSIEAGNALRDDPQAIAHMDLAQLRGLLTYCKRGERFCDGHWAAMIEQGQVLAILRRLAQLHQKF
ncbi:MAG: DUF6508 domain-containing protein [Pseudomonas farsensis]|uniref:DUF6508 domain-containing protein n=1 Tax=Pseudomonas farsensis TaxID=2745492 RepID=UPI003C7D2F75